MYTHIFICTHVSSINLYNQPLIKTLKADTALTLLWVVYERVTYLLPFQSHLFPRVIAPVQCARALVSYRF